jgi:iron complex transport system substrate-binding protein
LKRSTLLAVALAAGWSGIALAAAGASKPQHAATPQRVVSLNLCLDTLLVALVPSERIAAISHYSLDEWRSPIADLAKRMPITYETAEEVVSLKPDLVLTSRHSATATRHALTRVGIRFELFDVPASVAESIAQVRQVAALLGREEAGETLVARIEAAIAAARPIPGFVPLTAAVYQPGGLSAGIETVTGELMRIAGLENIAERYGIRQFRPLPLESLVAAPPQVLLVGETSPNAPTQAERLVQHRALRAIESHTTREIFPVRQLYCAGPTMIDALGTLVRARDHASSVLRARTAL